MILVHSKYSFTGKTSKAFEGKKLNLSTEQKGELNYLYLGSIELKVGSNTARETTCDLIPSNILMGKL